MSEVPLQRPKPSKAILEFELWVSGFGVWVDALAPPQQLSGLGVGGVGWSLGVRVERQTPLRLP